MQGEGKLRKRNGTHRYPSFRSSRKKPPIPFSLIKFSAPLTTEAIARSSQSRSLSSLRREQNREDSEFSRKKKKNKGWPTAQIIAFVWAAKILSPMEF